MKKTNDALIDGSIYFVLKNIRSIIITLCIVISFSIGMTLGYLLSLAGDGSNAIIVFWSCGILISAGFIAVIAMCNDMPYSGTYLKKFCKYVNDNIDYNLWKKEK